MKKTIPIMFLVMLSVTMFSGIIFPAQAALPTCPFTVPMPVLTHQRFSLSVSVSFSFSSSPPGVSDWGRVTLVSQSLRHLTYRVDIVVRGPQPPDCRVLWMTHTDTHTYTVTHTPKSGLMSRLITFTFEVWVNGVFANSIDFTFS
mgnify:CR=1 FL=1